MAKTTYLTLDAKGRATLPEEVREALGVGPGDFVQLQPTDHGTYELFPAELVPREDLWHFHPEFQARLAKSKEDIEKGRMTRIGTPEEVAAYFDSLKKRPAAKTRRTRSRP